MATHPMLWAIGHSAKSSDAFIATLRAWRIEQLADVRIIPRSRHNPQFNAEALTTDMTRAGMSYVGMPALGGLRKPLKDSFNNGWRNASFRGYVDYMQTDQFATSLQTLMTEGTRRRTAIGSGLFLQRSNHPLRAVARQTFVACSGDGMSAKVARE